VAVDHDGVREREATGPVERHHHGTPERRPPDGGADQQRRPDERQPPRVRGVDDRETLRSGERRPDSGERGRRGDVREVALDRPRRVEDLRDPRVEEHPAHDETEADERVLGRRVTVRQFRPAAERAHPGVVVSTRRTGGRGGGATKPPSPSSWGSSTVPERLISAPRSG
jgi:hypothetical protein